MLIALIKLGTKRAAHTFCRLWSNEQTKIKYVTKKIIWLIVLLSTVTANAIRTRPESTISNGLGMPQSLVIECLLGLNAHNIMTNMKLWNYTEVTTKIVDFDLVDFIRRRS